MSATHGLASTYRSQRYACRCDECKAAHTDLQRKEKAARGRRLADADVPHGTTSTYTNWGCRCPSCADAHRNYSARYYQARRVEAPR